MSRYWCVVFANAFGPSSCSAFGTSATMASEGWLEEQGQGRRARCHEALLRFNSGKQRHRRDAGAHNRSSSQRGFRSVGTRPDNRCRNLTSDHKRGTLRSPAIGLGGDTTWRHVFGRRPAVDSSKTDDSHGGGRGTRGRLWPPRNRVSRGASRPAPHLELTGAGPRFRTRARASRSFLRSSSTSSYRVPGMPTPRSSLRGNARSRLTANSTYRANQTSGYIRSTSAASAGTSTTRFGLWTKQASVSCFLRSIDDAPPNADADDKGDRAGDQREQFGFVTLHPLGDADFSFDDRDEDYPENWLEYDARGDPRLKSYYRGARPTTVHVTSAGRLGSGARAWFIPGKFRFCLRCGRTQGGPARDRTRLASLSAEGRSSATTVLVATCFVGCTALSLASRSSPESSLGSQTIGKTRRFRQVASMTSCS